MREAKRYVKHFIKKAVGMPDPSWPLFKFEQAVRPDTWNKRRSIIDTAESQIKNQGALQRNQTADDPRQAGLQLKQEAEQKFKNKYAHLTSVRVLIHVPEYHRSPGGYSLFKNFTEAFSFVGIQTKMLAWGDPLEPALNDFRPTILLTSDHETFLSKINWSLIKEYRKKNQLSVGLTASIAEYGNSPLDTRIDWAKKHAVDFYYTFRDLSYVRNRKEYRPFFENHYSILPLNFGANILSYYPSQTTVRDLDYVFLASQNKTKGPRYAEYLTPIVKKYSGLIDGPGWSKIHDFTFNSDRDRIIYSRAKVGLNVHIDEQIEWACETNERTYMLSACGVPQVTDHAKILDTLFDEGSMFIADTPKEYADYFERALHDPENAQKMALKAQRQVFEKYTTFHRVEQFLQAFLKQDDYR